MMNLHDRLDRIAKNLSAQVDDVYKLLEFDATILEHAIARLRELQDRLENVHEIKNPYLSVANTIKSLEDIRSNESLKPRYELINNQCIVLLVSFFGSTVHDLFTVSSTIWLRDALPDSLRKHDLKLTLGELADLEFDLSTQLGELISRKENISFQDMRSIKRAFGDYVGVDIVRDETTNNIVAAQAYRHVIAHNGGVVDEKLIRQLESAVPRDLKPNLAEGQHVHFQQEEIRLAASTMIEFVSMLVHKIKNQIPNP